MKATCIETTHSNTPFNVHLTLVMTLLLIGALIACLPSQVRAAEPFDRGNVTGSIVVGTGSALDRSYTTVGGTLGYMASEGLMLGISAQAWFGEDPGIFKLAPEVRYTLTWVEPVKPYAGVFASRTLYNGLPDRNTYGARGGVYLPVGSNGAFSVGLVYEKLSGCIPSTYIKCSQLYSEAGVLFSF